MKNYEWESFESFKNVEDDLIKMDKTVLFLTYNKNYYLWKAKLVGKLNDHLFDCGDHITNWFPIFETSEVKPKNTDKKGIISVYKKKKNRLSWAVEKKDLMYLNSLRATYENRNFIIEKSGDRYVIFTESTNIFSYNVIFSHEIDDVNIDDIINSVENLFCVTREENVFYSKNDVINFALSDGYKKIDKFSDLPKFPYAVLIFHDSFYYKDSVYITDSSERKIDKSFCDWISQSNTFYLYVKELDEKNKEYLVFRNEY